MATEKQITNALSVLEVLETCSKKTEREAILSKRKGNPVLQTILRMALGNDKYHIRPNFDPSICTSTLSIQKSWSGFLKLAARLNDGTISGNDGKGKVHKLLTATSPLLAKWMVRILLGNLRIGVSKKTISSVFGRQWIYEGSDNVAADFKFRGCMLAMARHKLPKKHSVLPYPLGVEYKLDGERFLCADWPNQKKIELVSRENHRKPHIETLTPLVKQLISVARKLSGGGDPIFLDGEFLDENWNKTSSIVGSTVNFDPVEFMSTTSVILFDWAPLARYEEGSFEMPWLQRKNHLLAKLCKDIDPEKVGPGLYRVSKNIFALGHSIVENEEELIEFYDRALELAFEGCMSKQLDAPARFDNYRGPLIVKHKPEDAKTGTIVKCVAGKENKNGPVAEAKLKKARKWMSQYGTIKDDGYYIKVRLPNADVDGKELEEELKNLTKDAVDLRVYLKPNGWITYRYSARLKHFVVRCGKETFQVGTGIGYKNGADARMKFWRKRKSLKGMKIDFKHQPDPNPVAVMRFNRFVRIREDL